MFQHLLKLLPLSKTVTVTINELKRKIHLAEDTLREQEEDIHLLKERLRIAEQTSINALAKAEGSREVATERYHRIEDLQKQVDWFAKRLGGKTVYSTESDPIEDPNQQRQSFIPMPMDNATRIKMMTSQFYEEYAKREGIVNEPDNS
jgi:hypothetical protein